MAIYKRRNLGDSLAGFMLKERNIYGSSMIGTSYDTLEMIGAHLDTVNAFHHLGNKNFFLENHLGNVLATVSDKKIPRFTNGILDHYEADIISSTDYYGFGQEEEGRNFNSKASRYGFNGKEKLNELEGEGDIYDFSARMYDARLGRWLSVDPLQSKYVNLSPYNYSENNPIYFSDHDGRDAVGKVDGNTITISATIYIDNSGANKINVDEAQKSINQVWGKDFTYKDETGKIYNVKFDITVKTISSKASENLVNAETNLVKPQSEKARSGVINQWYGKWASNKEASNEYAHEVGHFLGLADQYTDAEYKTSNLNPSLDGTKISWNYDDTPSNDIMGTAATAKGQSAKVSQKDVDAIAGFVLKTQKDGKAIINKNTLIGAGNGTGLASPSINAQVNMEMKASSNHAEIIDPHADKKAPTDNKPNSNEKK